jgi:hypothetical protein
MKPRNIHSASEIDWEADPEPDPDALLEAAEEREDDPIPDERSYP